jgi:hypothetical protein
MHAGRNYTGTMDIRFSTSVSPLLLVSLSPEPEAASLLVLEAIAMTLPPEAIYSSTDEL